MLHAANHCGEREVGDIARGATRHEDHATIGEREDGIATQRHTATNALFRS
jgi:hypothetical protein